MVLIRDFCFQKDYITLAQVIMMLYVEPDFYGEFQCLADKCAHSCCLGWEIDIDEETAALYEGLPGELGEELRQKMCREPEPHFCLTEEERCPFLNEKGLCRLILGFGEDVLCDICREHPRFYNAFPERQEAGLGLCCEEAARLLLTGDGPLELVYVQDEAGEGRVPELIALRGRMFEILSDLSLPMEERICRCCQGMGMEPPDFDAAFWRDFFLGLERMDEEWSLALLTVGTEIPPLPGDAKHTRLLQYMLYRHFAAAEDAAQAGLIWQFCVLSLRLLWAMEQSGAELRELVRLWSAEIEYSDENIGKIVERIKSLHFPKEQI